MRAALADLPANFDAGAVAADDGMLIRTIDQLAREAAVALGRLVEHLDLRVVRPG